MQEGAALQMPGQHHYCVAFDRSHLPQISLEEAAGPILQQRRELLQGIIIQLATARRREHALPDLPRVVIRVLPSGIDTWSPKP